MQRAFVEVIKDEDGVTLTSTTFEGQGKGMPMNTADNKPDWSFGPLDNSLKLTIYITIYHLDASNGRQTPSKMVGPLYVSCHLGYYLTINLTIIQINKQPEPGYPMELHSSTVSNGEKTEKHTRTLIS